MKLLVVFAVMGGIVAASVKPMQNYWKERNRPNFRDATVTRGRIVSVRNSTGTIKPVLSVKVGAFVSGPIVGEEPTSLLSFPHTADQFVNTVWIALRALAKNKMRAGLTVLGVVIGIAAVTTMVSIGESAGALIQGQFQSLGINVIVVMPGSRRQGGVRQSAAPTLTAQDAKAIVEECPSVLAVSPIVGASGQIIYGNNNWKPNEIFGVGADYLTVRSWPVRFGGFFTESDVTSGAKVCVVGLTIVEKLFQTSNPLGQTIRIKSIPLEIIGVLEPKGANLVGSDQDNIVLIPYTTVRKRLQGSSFDNERHCVLPRWLFCLSAFRCHNWTFAICHFKASFGPFFNEE